jgi:hypothetical protein
MSNWWRDPAQNKPPPLQYRDPQANPVQDPTKTGFNAANVNNMFTADEGRPQATDDPAYVDRRYNTMPLPGVRPYQGSNEDYLEQNSDFGALLQALQRYMGGGDTSQGPADGGQDTGYAK